MSPGCVVRDAGESLGSALAAPVILLGHEAASSVARRSGAAVGAGVVHPDPVHWTPALGEPVHGGHPLGVGEGSMSISYEGAGVSVLADTTIKHHTRISTYTPVTAGTIHSS